MRLARFLIDDQVRYALVEGDRLRELLRPFFESVTPMETTHALQDVRLLAPVRPSKILCVGINYRDHAEEMGHALPAEPVLFMKPETALLGPGAAIVYPAMAERVDYEAELGLVIGRTCRSVEPEDALDHVLGYTCVNDVTARDLQSRDGQWTRAKGFDTFGVVGPWIETEPGDVSNLTVTARLNGEERQHSTTARLIFDVPTLVSWLSRIMTLLPGDVIATGTPSGIGPMEPGDVVEVEVEGVGVLENPVVAERAGGARPARIL